MIPLAFEAFENKKFEDIAYFEPFYLKGFILNQKKIISYPLTASTRINFPAFLLRYFQYEFFNVRVEEGQPLQAPCSKTFTNFSFLFISQM